MQHRKIILPLNQQKNRSFRLCLSIVVSCTQTAWETKSKFRSLIQLILLSELLKAQTQLQQQSKKFSKFHTVLLARGPWAQTLWSGGLSLIPTPPPPPPALGSCCISAWIRFWSVATASSSKKKKKKIDSEKSWGLQLQYKQIKTIKVHLLTRTCVVFPHQCWSCLMCYHLQATFSSLSSFCLSQQYHSDGKRLKAASQQKHGALAFILSGQHLLLRWVAGCWHFLCVLMLPCLEVAKEMCARGPVSSAPSSSKRKKKRSACAEAQHWNMHYMLWKM